MTARPFLSFVVPVYNVEKYVDACLESLEAQDDRDFEVIVVDDGSTDGSLGRVRAHAERLPAATIVSQDNRGLGAARNAGLARARGEWIAFLDSDDAVDPRYCSTIRRNASRGADVVEFNMVQLEDGERSVTDIRESFSPEISYPSACNKVYKADVWRDLRFPEGILFEDIAVIPYILCTRRVERIDDALYVYNIRPSSIMTTNQMTRNMDILAAFDHLRSLFDGASYASRAEAIDFYLFVHVMKYRYNKLYGFEYAFSRGLSRRLRRYVREKAGFPPANRFFRMLPTKDKARILVNLYMPFPLAYAIK